MKKINYPLIISDFDGTLYRSDKQISKNTIETVARYVKDGGAFAVSSGRALPSILPIVKEMGLKGVVAAYNGAVIADITTGELLDCNTMSVESGVEICRAFEERGLHTHVYLPEEYYATARNEYLARYEAVVKVKAIIPNETLSVFVERNKLQAIKILAVLEPEKRDGYIAELSRLFGDKYYVTSGSKNLIEISSKTRSKGTAVKFIADYYGVPVAKTVAVGDALNDLPMLQTAGVGLAVKNAEKSLLENAENFPYSNDEDAVAKIIEKYGYTEE